MFINMTYFLQVVLPALIAIVIGVIIERILAYLVSKFGKRRELDPSHVHLLKLIARWLIIIVLVIVVAGIFGIGARSIWVSLAAFIAMMVLGFFAAWSILSNLLAFLIIMVVRPFRMGNSVVVMPENIAGEIIDINLLYHKLKTKGDGVILVPNVTFITKFVLVSSEK
jgi:small conductance mechanosensitive channel